MHEIEIVIRKFPDHEVILGVDANTKVFSFEDGWHVGPCTKPAKLTSKEKRESVFIHRVLTRTGLVLANTWNRDGRIGEATKKPWHKCDFLEHVDEDRDTQIDFVAVRATSCVQSCEVDHSLDTLGIDTIGSDHCPSLAAFPLRLSNRFLPSVLHVC